MSKRTPLPIGALESIQASTPDFTPPHKRTGFVRWYAGFVIVLAFLAIVGRLWN